jgi:acetamidase/formamidase
MRHRRRSERRAFFLVAFAAILFAALSINAQEKGTLYKLKATPDTVVWGRYDAKAPPVLRVKSGDSVEMETVLTSSPPRLEHAGVASNDVEQCLREIYAGVPQTNRGPGGHILTGPVYIEGADPGDALEVRIVAIKLAIPYAYNAFGLTSGFLPEDFHTNKMRIIPLDREKMIANFSDGIQIPLHPFFGSMGVAPSEEVGRVDSAPPGTHAGNLDNKDLVAGTTLFIPVHAPGALFEAGDGHAGQGNGEVDITAMETSLVGTFQFIVHKGMHLNWPRAETPTHYISMGIDRDLTPATKLAVREMIDFLVNEKHMTREDAYMLCSVAVDFNITQLVDGTKGVHGLLPKAIFTGKK